MLIYKPQGPRKQKKPSLSNQSRPVTQASLARVVVTAEVTAEVIAEVTAEVTAEATAEVIAGVTAGSVTINLYMNSTQYTPLNPPITNVKKLMPISNVQPTNNSSNKPLPSIKVNKT